MVVVVRMLGLGALALLIGAVGRADGAFPGLNGRIVVMSASSIRLLTLDGRISVRPHIDAYRAVWSPTGRRLLLSKDGGVYVTDASVSRLRRIPIPNRWGLGQPDASWSPDGTQIVFSADIGRRGCRALFTFRLRDRRERQLLSGCSKLPPGQPSWSPTGRLIAYNTGGRVCLLTLTTRKRACLAAGDQPTWSPDGTQLAYTAPDERSIVRLNVHTPATKVIVTRAGLDDPQETVSSAAWSPDGSMLAFVRAERAPAVYENHLYLVNIDGSSIRPLAANDNERPDWQPVFRSR